MSKPKPYSLDYTIHLAKDRNAAVTEILNNLEYDLNHSDLEQLADYILYGKDEKHLSIIDTKEALQPKRRYGTWKTKAEKLASLDELLDTPMVGPALENEVNNETTSRTRYRVIKPEIRKPVYDDEGNLIDPGDTDIPGMVELQDRIATLQERYDMYVGKIPPNDYVRTHPKTKYQLYKFNHMLIDIKRHQYYLKDAYKPTLKFFNIRHPGAPALDFCADTGLWLTPEQWCARKRNPKPFDLPQPTLENVRVNEEGKYFWVVSENTIDYENADHIIALLDNYVNLLKHCYDKPYTSTRTLLWDLESFIEDANLTDEEQMILELKVAHKNNFIIRQILAQEGIVLSDTELRSRINRVIPYKITQAARKRRVLSDFATGKIDGLVCTRCNRKLPKDTFFFCKSSDKRTGYCSQCKDCQKSQRKLRLPVNPKDLRKKGEVKIYAP